MASMYLNGAVASPPSSFWRPRLRKNGGEQTAATLNARRKTGENGATEMKCDRGESLSDISSCHVRRGRYPGLFIFFKIPF